MDCTLRLKEAQEALPHCQSLYQNNKDDPFMKVFTLLVEPQILYLTTLL